MACCVDRCTKPLTMLTKLPNYTSDKLFNGLNTGTDITAATTRPTSVLINHLSLIRNFPGSDVLVEGVVQIDISGLAIAGATSGTLSVVLDVYRNGTTTADADRIYSVSKNILDLLGVTVSVPALTDEIAFQFTDNETTTNYAAVPASLPLPDTLNPAEYFVRASIVTTGGLVALIIPANITIRVTRSDTSASEEVVYV
ncbi:hypothetical protein [Clostridium sp. 'White wine YQ']|uniref:hypothetical protein n=1 Tax=Clostridium sp. 'White wine YQ' TaxID=3027474 RepID=UPI002366ACBD|nr:hypothetical protein [Clostridium sp. 'White wine YQ']MDD7796100.1 hypothetical protein [Clostridium sp. 'White wine YQ']